MLNLVDGSVNLKCLRWNWDASIDEHADKSGASCGINAIVDSLRFSGKVEAKQAKNEGVRWLSIKLVERRGIRVVNGRGEEICALEFR